MKTLSIDIETYSSNDLKTGGVYKYVQAPDFEILLFAYSIDNGPVQIVDLWHGEELPIEINHALTNPDIIKTAFNAQFERICIARHFVKVLTPDQWECSMVKSAMLGLPLSLEQVGKVLKLDTQKDSTGKALIRYFSIPCKPSKANNGRTRNLPIDDPEKWQQFKSYCIKDVETETAIRNAISGFKIPEQEKRLYTLDQKINDTGIGLDENLINNTLLIDDQHTKKIRHEAKLITGLENPYSVAQLKNWIKEKENVEIDSLNKEVIPVLIDNAKSEDVKKMLKLRVKMAKSSIKKYQTMTNCICTDKRAHGLVQFYGANRTGRWSGRLVQIQNLPRISMKDIEVARNLVREGNEAILNLVYSNIPDTLSQLIRTAFIPKGGNRFIVADFSAIEARVIAWLAGERWRLEVFKTHGKIYEASASAMFKVPIAEITKDSPLRQKGKISELALGYGGSVGALTAMGALKMGLYENELQPLVALWRGSNRAICRYWKEVNNAAIEAVENGFSKIGHNISFICTNNILFINLPSGRKLAYRNPEIRPGKFDQTALHYHGQDQTTKKWKRIDTFGGKLVENIVQAVSRDLLAEAMLRLDNAGYNIVSHIHDEVIMEMPEGKGSLEEAINIMTKVPKWAKGLPIAADGFESNYYKK